MGWCPTLCRCLLACRCPPMRLRAALPGLILAAFEALLPGARPAAAELPATRLQIRIPERGIYELAPADLAAAGVPVNDPSFDPRTLRLLFDTWKPVPLLADSIPSSWQADYEMREVAIWVPGEDDGRLDPADRVVFYALGPAGWDDLAGVAADSLAHSEHPYDRFDSGWMVWGGAAGLRMETRSASAPEPLADPLVTRVGHREHCEKDRIFVPYGDLWAWERVLSTATTRVQFDLDLGADSSATGGLRVQLGCSNGATDGVEVRLNDALLGVSPSIRPETAMRVSFGSAPLRNHNVLALRPVGSMVSGAVMLLELDATWDRPLVTDARGELAWSGRPASPQNVYELQFFGASEPFVFDVTDHLWPVRLTNPTPVGEPVRWRVRHGRGAGERVHYLAGVAPRRLDPETDLELRTVAPLRSRTSSPDMLIVTHPDLLPAAERLAAHRRNHLPGVTNPDVLVTTTRDIYESFSGGRQDPLAIRNWVKFLYGLSSEPRLAYLLLLGDGTRDPRQVLAGSAPTLVPTVQAAYADPRIKRAYAVEDWLGAMHTPASVWLAPQADVSIGRLPAQDLDEAEQLVDKIVTYESGTPYGPWQGRVLIAADDECNGSSNCYEGFFVRDTERLTAAVPAELDVRKVYMTEYPLVQYQKPDARSAFIRSWNKGCVLLNYYGHGASGQLASEVLFLATDIPSLTNGGQLPLFVTIGCNVSEFDIPARQSLCELLVAAPNGGAIATIGATTSPYVGPAYAVSQQQFAELFRQGATTQQPIGLVHRLAKGVATPNNEQFVLLGDPALVLRLPRALVTLISGADSLAIGRRARIEGFVHWPGASEPLEDFDGEAAIEVLGNSDESGYERTEPPALEIPYVLPGEPIYRGQVQVHAGRFAFEFTVPPPLGGDSTCTKGIRFGPGARVAAYAWNAQLDAKGGRDGVVLTPGSGQDSSLAPPRIRLAFPGGATRVVPGAVLTAQIEDENGVWIAGQTPASSIWLTLDGGEPLDVTASYRSTGGSDAAGTVSMPLPSLAPGPHRAILSASDNLGNGATADLDFEIVETPFAQLTDFRAAPNPTRVGADFAFVLDVPAEVELRLFTVDGRQVFRSQGHHDGLRRGLVRWNGKGADDRMVASGVYLYKLGVRPAAAPLQELTGKIVVLR